MDNKIRSAYKDIKDPGTKLDLFINKRLTSIPLSSPGVSSLNSLMAKESEDKLRLKQFRIQNLAESALSSAGSARTPCNVACLKLESVMHVPSRYPRTCLCADPHCK